LVGYVPLYDYQNHLLESQVLVKYDDPQFNYQTFYDIREGWYLRSNALTAIMMAALGQLIPMDYSGKAVLTLYMIVFGSGYVALLHITKRPFWSILLLPVLLYNFTFTTGMLNWSYGFALAPWVILSYLSWREERAAWKLVGLALLLFLVYIAHILAWGLLLIVLFTFTAVDGINKRDSFLLLFATMSAVPLLLLTRPVFGLAPVILFLVLWSLRTFFLRVNFSLPAIAIFGIAGTFIFLFGIRLFQPQIQQIFPDVGYSSYNKTVSLVQTFALPHHYGAEDTLLVPLNLIILGLIIVSGVMLAIVNGKVYRAQGVDSGKWLAACFLMLLGYFLVPSRTHDILVTEPRLLLFALFIGLFVIKNPFEGSRIGMLALSLLVLTAAVSLFSIWYYTLRYDDAAQNWARQLEQVPAGKRLLVFSNPLPDQVNQPYKMGQIFDQNQFANIYPLEKGGFASNTFFNGPLLPHNPDSIPPYWWVEFSPGPYIDRFCERLKPEYDYVLLWNPRSPGLLETLNMCFGVPEYQLPDLWLWRGMGD
jgi:hypothetical protein